MNLSGILTEPAFRLYKDLQGKNHREEKLIFENHWSKVGSNKYFVSAAKNFHPSKMIR